MTDSHSSARNSPRVGPRTPWGIQGSSWSAGSITAICGLPFVHFSNRSTARAGPSKWSSWFHPLMNLSLDVSCGTRNWAGYPCDEQGDALRQAFFAAPDDASRRAGFEAFQRRMWEYIPYVPAGTFVAKVSYP